MTVKEMFYLTMLKFIARNMDAVLKNTDKMTKEEYESTMRIKDELDKINKKTIIFNKR